MDNSTDCDAVDIVACEATRQFASTSVVDPDSWIRIQDFHDHKLGEKYSWKEKKIFLDQKLLFTYPCAFLKDAQATGEAFRPPKRTSSFFTTEIKFF
jgi:hypothetical protein